MGSVSPNFPLREARERQEIQEGGSRRSGEKRERERNSGEDCLVLARREESDRAAEESSGKSLSKVSLEEFCKILCC